MNAATKDSGVKWIGTVPADWEINKIKYIASLKGRIGWQGLTSEEYTDEGAYLITGVDFKDGGIDWESCEHIPMHRWEEARDIQIENGDLLITKDGTIGKVAIVDGCTEPTSLNSGVLRISTIDGYDRRFLYWVLQSDVFWEWFADANAGNSTIQHLYQGDFAEFKYAIPQVDEQKAIANYLDVECAKLDEIIATVESQIAVLTKYRSTLIREATTKGLRPNTASKQSKVPAIGDIPEEWMIYRVKDVAKLSSGSTPDRANIQYWDGDICWVKTGELQNDYLYDTEEKITAQAFRDSSLSMLQKGTILMAMYGQGKTRGMTAMLKMQSTTNQACAAIAVKKEFDPDYIWYAIMGSYESIREEAQGSGQPNLSLDIVKNFKIAAPPIEEQKEIAAYLSKRKPIIDDMLAREKSALSKVKEQKKALIYEYVTGKKRIKGVN